MLTLLLPKFPVWVYYNKKARRGQDKGDDVAESKRTAS